MVVDGVTIPQQQQPVGRSRRSRRRRRERGQALLEFALSAPILVVLLLGLVEFGHGLNAYLTVINAARDAARLSAQIGASDTTRLKNLVDGEMSRLPNAPVPLGCSGAGICVTSCTTTSGPCNPVNDKWVNVRVCYSHDLIVGVPWIFSGPLEMCSQTRIRIAS
jgi:Flp pilus assembly protein TadG